MIIWVTVKRFCKVTGYTEDAVEAKRLQGVWPEGIIWRKAPDGRIHIHTRNYNKWVAGQVCVPSAKKPSRSTSSTGAKGAGNVSVLHRPRAT